ncbi:MAG TPA: VOC family protein [Ktedonobacteraceae bacterium]|nr:VOC family protein [Ktedonobacteraceae bacterium]
MNPYVPPANQLIVELYVRDLRASCEFYQRLGFQLARDDGDFVELQWEDSLLFLEEVPAASPPPSSPVGNIRIMVPNVDDYWSLAQELGAQVLRPLEDRYYGLRDFTIVGPDGLGLRFATRLSDIRKS